MSDSTDNKNTSSNHKLMIAATTAAAAATTSDTIIAANKNTQTDMKSEYAFKEELKNFKASFNGDTVNDEDDKDDVDNYDHLTTIKGNHVMESTMADATTNLSAAAAIDAMEQQHISGNDNDNGSNAIIGTGTTTTTTINEQINMMQQINDDNNDSITLKLLWPPKQLQFNQSDVLPDNKKLSKMVHNNKMYQIIRDNNSFKSKNILNATDTFCDNYKNELNVAKSDNMADRCVDNTRKLHTHFYLSIYSGESN